MAFVSYQRNRAELTCTYSGILAAKPPDTGCCEGMLAYEPIILDFGKNIWQKRAIINSDANALRIRTQNQTIWLLDIKDIVLMEEGKLAVKFEHLIIY